MIPAPASDLNGVYTAMANAKFVTGFSNGGNSKTVITLCAMQIVQTDEIMKKKIILRLGIFAYLRATGHFTAQPGIDHVWKITNLLGFQKVYSVLNCGQGPVKLAIDTHEKTLMALYALLYKSMLGNYPSLLKYRKQLNLPQKIRRKHT